MFCTNCGKPTENNQTLCNDCLQAGAQQAQPQQAYQQPQYQQAPYQPQYQQPQYQQPYQPQYQQPYYAPQAPKAPAVTGPTLGKAITGIILASIALFVLTYVYFYIEANIRWTWHSGYYSYGYYYSGYYSYYYPYTEWSLVMILLMLPPAIIGLVFGAKSIGGSNMVLADGTRKKHIPTLILGIAALVIGISAISMFGLSSYTALSWW